YVLVHKVVDYEIERGRLWEIGSHERQSARPRSGVLIPDGEAGIELDRQSRSVMRRRCDRGIHRYSIAKWLRGGERETAIIRCPIEAPCDKTIGVVGHEVLFDRCPVQRCAPDGGDSGIIRDAK